MRKSINKTTVIIVLALFLTISVGYALFSDTITIEGTATAQGKFDIKVECLSTIPINVSAVLTLDQLGLMNTLKITDLKVNSVMLMMKMIH